MTPVAPPYCTQAPLIDGHGTQLWFELDLRAHAFANFDFWDATQTRMPLHVSVRRDQGCITLNRWGPEGWRREWHLDATLGARLHHLTLEFRPVPLRGMSLVVVLDGAVLGQVDGWPRPDAQGRFGLRRGFADLGQITHLNAPPALRVARHIPPLQGGLGLSDRLELIWRTPAPHAELVLADDDTVAFLPHPTPMQAPALQVLPLPGRVWHRYGAEAVTLALRGAPAETAEFALGKDDIAQAITRNYRSGLMQRDQFAQLAAIEHAHYAALWPRLPADVTHALTDAAHQMQLHRFAPPAKPPALPPPDPAALACDSFHRACAGATLDPETAFPALVQDHALDANAARGLSLMLCEWFCLNADVTTLCNQAQAAGVSDWPLRNQIWADTAAIPFYWHTGQLWAIETLLYQHKTPSQGWIVTPALGWLVRALVDDRPDAQGYRAPLHQRVKILYALSEFIAAQIAADAAQIYCEALIDALVHLLARSHLLPDWCRRDITRQIAQSYALCPAFWAAFDRADLAATAPQLAALGVQFRALDHAIAARAPVTDAALAVMSHPLAGRARLARALGAIDRLSNTAPDLARAAPWLDARAQAETALRWLAFPRTPKARAAIDSDAAKALFDLARKGLRHAAEDIPRPDMDTAMRRLSQQVFALFDALAKTAEISDAQIDDLSELATALICKEAQFTGISACLAAAEALLRAARPAQATRLIMGLETALHHSPDPVGNAARLAVSRFVALCPDDGLRARVGALLQGASFDPENEHPLAARLRAQANPLFDGVIALISCQKYLPTRRPACLQAWGDRAAALGVPVITVVGRAPGAVLDGPQFDGQILTLDAPDDYEGLPQKILALMDWVQTQTGFSRVLKIDDDCFLNADAFFGDLAALGADYYGRPLLRAIGTLDREWHRAKSRTPRGRLELDKSPEPSLYAEGGAGYLLSRRALQALNDVARSPEGRALAQMSFMEDKLVGDLLALRDIYVTNENYDLAIFRHSARGLPPLPLYENSFLPFQGSGIKLAHLDAGGDLMQARAALDSPWPQPMKIWPVARPARLGWGKNTLDLVSDPARLDTAIKAKVTVIGVMRNERRMLDHYLDHYRRLGVGAFLIADNGSDDGTLEYLSAQPDVAVFTTDTPYNLSDYGVIWQEALMANFRLGKWSLVADADELAFWSLPDAQGHVHGDLAQLVARPDIAQSQAVRLDMLDMYPQGPLSQAAFKTAPFAEATHLDAQPLCTHWQGRGPWSNSATLTSALRHRLLGKGARANLFVAQKYALLKYSPWMRLSQGLHYISGAKIAPQALAFAHFKYHAAFLDKARAEVARGQHFNNAEEYRKYLIALSDGRDMLFDPAISVPLGQCAHVQHMIAALKT